MEATRGWRMIAQRSQSSISISRKSGCAALPHRPERCKANKGTPVQQPLAQGPRGSSSRTRLTSLAAGAFNHAHSSAPALVSLTNVPDSWR
jgi:hypothetical protein